MARIAASEISVVGGPGFDRGIKLDQMLPAGHAAHPVLNEFHCFVVLQPEKASRSHEVALAQAMAGHFFIIAGKPEHRPFHDELCGPFGTIWRMPNVFISRWTIRFGQIVDMVTDHGLSNSWTKSMKRGSRSVMPSL